MVDITDETTPLIANLQNKQKSVKSNNEYAIRVPNNNRSKKKNEVPQQSSLLTIFSVWNMMMGTSLLTMPWAFLTVGFVEGIIINAVMCVISVYLGYLVLNNSTRFVTPLSPTMPEFDIVARIVCGEWARWASFIGSFLLVSGAYIVYWIIMVQLLYTSVDAIYSIVMSEGVSGTTGIPSENMNCTNTSLQSSVVCHGSSIPYWSETHTVPFLLIPIFLPILQARKVTFFLKLSAFGTVTILVLLFYAVVKSATWGLNISFNQTSPLYVAEFTWKGPTMFGILSMAYFFHNSIITLFKHNKDPKQSIRDMAIGTALVFATYLTFGLLIYLCFPLDKTLIHQNFLETSVVKDIFSIVLQVIYFFRMVTVFPVLCVVQRIQFMSTVYGTENPSRIGVFVYNVFLCASCVVCAIFFPNIGDIIRYVGAFCAMILMFIFPCIIHLLLQKRDHQGTWKSVSFHSFLIIIGVTNFVTQFLVQT